MANIAFTTPCTFDNGTTIDSGLAGTVVDSIIAIREGEQWILNGSPIAEDALTRLVEKNSQLRFDGDRVIHRGKVRE